MPFDGSSLSAISLDDIRDLVSSRAPERPDLEYKRQPYDASPTGRLEMLRDIAAMANACGGYLILGIAEDGQGRAESFCWVPDAHLVRTSMHDTCIDGIRERLSGLEVEAFSFRPGENIVIVRIPPSGRKPHMVAHQKRTDFWCRYGTSKQPMTFEEIRGHLLEAPLAQEVSKLRAAVQVQGKPATGPAPQAYFQIVTEQPLERFLRKLFLSNIQIDVLLIVSPFIGTLVGTRFELRDLVQRVASNRIPTYVITRQPVEDYHKEAIEAFLACDDVEIRYNPAIHAKLYVCWCRDMQDTFGLFGSANLTYTGLSAAIELGVMVFGKGPGRQMMHQLYDWGINLRYLAGTTVAKHRAITRRT